MAAQPRPPIAPPRPSTPRPPAPSPSAVGKAQRVPWGWLEWVIVAQTAFSAMLFIPGLTPLRLFSRIGSFAIGLVALAFVKRRPLTGSGFSATPWLLGCTIWMSIMVLHPQTNSLPAGLAELGLCLAVMSPSFQAGGVLVSSKQLGRLMAIILVCNGVSSLVGIGQVYRPDIFSPKMEGLYGGWIKADEMGTIVEGDRMIVRPSGLTDTPGAASHAGLLAGMAGVGWALQSTALWKRLAALGLAFAGTYVIYFGQARLMLLIELGSLLTLFAILLAQRDWKRVTWMGIGGPLVFLGALAAVAASSGGEGILKRFGELLEDDPTKVYNENRGNITKETLERGIFVHPLGAGMGRFGQPYVYFGDHAAPPSRGILWTEVQAVAWLHDGGIPLMIAYMAAVVLAIADAIRIALRTPDQSMATWAAVICALNIGIAISGLGWPVFVTPMGLLFWLLAGTLHAADARVRVERRRRPAGVAAPRVAGL